METKNDQDDRFMPGEKDEIRNAIRPRIPSPEELQDLVEIGRALSRLAVERCRVETNHSRVAGTNFCQCGHAMFDDDLTDADTEQRLYEEHQQNTKDAFGEF